jgi:hypothetical protein
MLNHKYSVTVATLFVIAAVPACKGFGPHQADDASGPTDRIPDGGGSGGALGGSDGRTGSGGTAGSRGGNGGIATATGGAATGGSPAATGGGPASTGGSTTNGTGGLPGTGGRGSGGGTGGMVASSGGTQGGTGGTVPGTGGSPPGTGGQIVATGGQGTGGQGTGGQGTGGGLSGTGGGTGGAQPCGGVGETCCAGQTCGPGSFCGAGNNCTACSGPSACCSNDHCAQPNPICNTTTHVCGPCTPPSSASAVHFVDPTEGFDDPEHGASYGRCGVKTLAYALTRATDQIALKPAVYELPPDQYSYRLTGSQKLRCSYQSSGRATIRALPGAGWIGAWTLIDMIGEGTELHDCIIDGMGGRQINGMLLGICVNSWEGGLVQDTDIGNCGQAGIVALSSLPFDVLGSTIHDSAIGAEFGGDNPGILRSNVFRSNGTDVVCHSPTPSRVGSSNSNPTTGDGKISCTKCENCPF